MKLTFITQNEAPFRMRWMDELAKYIDVQVFHIGEYENDINMAYIDYHTCRAVTQKNALKFFKWNIFDIRKIKESKYSVLLLDGYGFTAQQILMIWLILTKQPYGLTVDGGFIPLKEGIIKRNVKKFFISHADFWFSTGEYTDKLLTYYGAKEKRIHRHYFSNVLQKDIIDRPLSKEEKRLLRQSLKLDGKFIFIAVGRLIPRKGFDILSKALDMMDEECTVLIIGGGQLTDVKMKI